MEPKRPSHYKMQNNLKSQWYNNKLIDRKLSIISASSQSTDVSTSRKLGPRFNALRPMLNVWWPSLVGSLAHILRSCALVSAEVQPWFPVRRNAKVILLVVFMKLRLWCLLVGLDSLFVVITTIVTESIVDMFITLYYSLVELFITLPFWGLSL